MQWRQEWRGFFKIVGPNGTRTIDLFRVNFEVNNLKPFSRLVFPQFRNLEQSPRLPSFDGELMASSQEFSSVPSWQVRPFIVV